MAKHLLGFLVVLCGFSPSLLASDRYDDLIIHHSQRTGIPADWIKAVIQTESSFRESVVSPAGAQGLMQLMPATAKRFGVKAVFDPDQNIQGGTDYLKWLFERYRNWRLVLAAYNAGEGTVDRYGGIPPYQETQTYVEKVLAARLTYRDVIVPEAVLAVQSETEGAPLPVVIEPVMDSAFQLFEAALTASMVVSW